MPALLLVVLSLLIMLGRVAAPFGQPSEGRELLSVRLGLVERVLYHRSGLYAFGAILLILALGGMLSPAMQLLAVLVCYGILMVPVRYRLTTVGVGVNGVVFRRWSEFDGADASRRAITLPGRTGHARFTLRLLAAHQAGALDVIRRQVRPANIKGRNSRAGQPRPLAHR